MWIEEGSWDGWSFSKNDDISLPFMWKWRVGLEFLPRDIFNCNLDIFSYIVKTKRNLAWMSIIKN